MKQLEPLLKELRKVTDKINQPIDDDIIEMVAVLNYLGFPTNSSCQGHPETGSKFNPWVIICVPKEEKELKDPKEYYKFAKKNLSFQKPLLNYLNQFYKNRNTEYQHRLTINTIQCGILELYPLSLWATEDIKDMEERKLIHSIYKKEMDDFRDFLKTKIK